MPPLWDPLTLAFSDTDLESHYSKYRSVNAFIAVDLVFAYFGLGSALSIVWGCWRKKLSSTFFLISGANVMCAVCMLLSLKRQSQSWFLKKRTWIVSLFRAVRVAIGIIVSSKMPKDMEEWNPLRSLFLYAFMCIYWTGGMPLSIKAHTVHHVAFTAIAFLHLQRAYCAHHHDLWHTVFTTLKWSHPSNAVLHVDSLVEECRRSILFILFTVGFALPTCVLWMMELRSRIYYMDRMEIPIVGSISSYYMMKVLISASVFIWLLVVFPA